MAENTTPAKTTRTKKTAPALDFSSLTVTEAAAPVRENSVSATDNPALPWVRASWEGKTPTTNSAGQPAFIGAGRQVVVPNANANQVESLIRKAAVQLGRELGERIGVAVVKEELTGKDRGKTAVRFAAKTGKQPYKRTGTDNGNTAQNNG